jgi:hypothetical protein
MSILLNEGYSYRLRGGLLCAILCRDDHSRVGGLRKVVHRAAHLNVQCILRCR